MEINLVSPPTNDKVETERFLDICRVNDPEKVREAVLKANTVRVIAPLNESPPLRALRVFLVKIPVNVRPAVRVVCSVLGRDPTKDRPPVIPFWTNFGKLPTNDRPPVRLLDTFLVTPPENDRAAVRVWKKVAPLTPAANWAQDIMKLSELSTGTELNVCHKSASFRVQAPADAGVEKVSSSDIGAPPICRARSGPLLTNNDAASEVFVPLTSVTLQRYRGITSFVL